MPRIRSIKPEFWQDQKLSRLPAMTRLVYVCLWSMADDEGRIEADAETVWHFGFPREKPEDIAKALRVLAEASRIVLYLGSNGSELISIPRWSFHQKIDKPTRSKIEAPPEVTTDSTTPREDSTNPRESSTTDRDMDMDLEGDQDLSCPQERTSPPVEKSDPPTLPPLVLLWNEKVAGRLPTVRSWTPSRDRGLKARLREEPDLAVWGRAIDALLENPWNTGTNPRGWKADFDYLLAPSKAGRLLDAGRAAAEPQAPPVDDYVPPSVRRQRESDAAVLKSLQGALDAGRALTAQDAERYARLTGTGVAS
jgi:hypothetical protein